MTWITIVAAAGVAALLFVRHQLQVQPLAVAAGEPARVPVHHVGADESWRPALEVAAPVAATAGHTPADLEELTILADFDALIESWRTDPPWLTEFRDLVDGAYALAGMDTAVHHRWRGGALDVPTAEWALVPVAAGAR